MANFTNIDNVEAIVETTYQISINTTLFFYDKKKYAETKQ